MEEEWVVVAEDRVVLRKRRAFSCARKSEEGDWRGGGDCGSGENAEEVDAAAAPAAGGSENGGFVEED